MISRIFGPSFALEHVDAGDFEPHHRPRGDGRLQVALVERTRIAEPTAMQIRTEIRPALACRRIDATTFPPTTIARKIASLRLGDILLKNDVLPHRPEGFQQRRHGLRRLGDRRSNPLRPLLELHDRRSAADEAEREVNRVGRARADGLGDVDVAAW